MAQEFHNIIDVIGSSDQRLRFSSYALTESLKWGWDWMRLEINSEAHRGGDSGKTRLDFYTRNSPRGLDTLMTVHPEITLDCQFLDLSFPKLIKMLMCNNEVLEESVVENADEIFDNTSDEVDRPHP